MSRKPEVVTQLLQIPVKAAIAERIAEYGKNVSKTQAQFALICLEVALENWRDVSDRIASRLAGLLGTAIPQSRKLKQQAQDDRIVRIQVHTPRPVLASLEALASEMNHTPVQAAGWLLERVVMEQDWIIRMVLNPLVLDVTRWVQGLQKSPIGNNRPKASPT